MIRPDGASSRPHASGGEVDVGRGLLGNNAIAQIGIVVRDIDTSRTLKTLVELLENDREGKD